MNNSAADSPADHIIVGTLAFDIQTIETKGRRQGLSRIKL